MDKLKTDNVKDDNHGDLNLYPVWQDPSLNDVQSIFKLPSWIDEKDRASTGQGWYDCMSGQKVRETSEYLYLFDQSGGTGQKNNVWENGTEVYGQVYGQQMPPGGSFVPAILCEKLRLWYNQGGRDNVNDVWPGPHKVSTPIPSPKSTKRAYRPSKRPVWDNSTSTEAKVEDDIKLCFQNPCWVDFSNFVATRWQIAMQNFIFDDSVDPAVPFDIQNYEHVKAWGRTVYDHVASQSMPIDPPWFPEEAVEAIRLWYNGGCPQTEDDIPKVSLPEDPIPKERPEKPFRVRKDINHLTPEELQTYRMKLLNHMHSDRADHSKWQKGGFIHSNWCLHYMQASFPWHRAHLLWLEDEIKFPIPYWNFFSKNAADPTHLDSGIPQAFLDDEFTDSDGLTHKNPLRHAFARKGKSRASKDNPNPQEVKRSQPFEDPNGAISRDDWITGNVPGYLDQIWHATQMTDIGSPQKFGDAFTFAQSDLTPENLLEFYLKHLQEFDGMLEQAHDNLHGWCGPDMANNSYAAFDPLFWSFHANFDRIFENWMRDQASYREQTIQWSSNFPLRPFVRKNNRIVAREDETRTYSFTTLGDMVKNVKTLGYTYALPVPGSEDYVGIPIDSKTAQPWVFFPGVKCMSTTYTIHVAIDYLPDGKELTIDDVKNNIKGYIGPLARLGMGPDDGNGRCVQDGVVRRLDASKAVQDVGTIKPGDLVWLKQLITEEITFLVPQQVAIPQTTWSAWPGFKGYFVWLPPPNERKTA